MSAYTSHDDYLKATEGPGTASAAERHGSLGLPCHTSEQVAETTNHRGGKTQRLARHRVELEIQGMCIRWGVNRIGFLTFTFDPKDGIVKTIAEAQKRLRRMFHHGPMENRYAEWVAVVQRHKDNRIHFHFVVVLAEDIRTGFNFAAVKKRDYSSASPYLKAEWKFLRETMTENEFGRHELLPVINPQGFGLYVARYVGRSENTRLDEKGTRLVRFSKGFTRCVVGPFSVVDIIGARARTREPKICQSLGIRRLQTKFGPRWKYHLRRLLYCDDRTFGHALARIEYDLEFYKGAQLIIDEAFEWLDGIRQEYEDRDRKIAEMGLKPSEWRHAHFPFDPPLVAH